MVLLSLCAYRQRKFPVLLHHIVLAPLVFALTQRRELSEATQASSAMVTAVIRRIRLAIVAVVILFVAVPSAWACAPLVVFIGGFDEKPSKGKGAREVWIEEMKRYRDTGKNIKTLFFLGILNAPIFSSYGTVVFGIGNVELYQRQFLIIGTALINTRQLFSSGTAMAGILPTG